MGELGHPRAECGLRREAELGPGQGGRCRDMPYVTEPELAGDHRLGPAECPRQGACHLADRVRFAAGDVVGAQASGLAGPPVLAPCYRRQVRRRDIRDVHEVAPLRAVLEYSRRLARFERGPEYGRYARVWSVPGHPRSVDVVVPQRHHLAAGQACPDSRELFLRDLADRVGIARVQRRGLGHRHRAQLAAAPRAQRLEPGSGQVLLGSPRRAYRAVLRAVVAALAVDHHRGGKDQPGYLAPPHLRQQHRGAGHVDIAVGRQVG